MVTIKVIGNIDISSARLDEYQLSLLRQANDCAQKAIDILDKVAFSDSFKKNNANWCSAHEAIHEFVWRSEDQIKKEIIYERN